MLKTEMIHADHFIGMDHSIHGSFDPVACADQGHMIRTRPI